jgi:hypothetical protein
MREFSCSEVSGGVRRGVVASSGLGILALVADQLRVVAERLAYISPSRISCLQSIDERRCGEDQGDG